MLFFVMAASVIFVALSPQKEAEPRSPEITYHSNAMHLEFAYPAGFKDPEAAKNGSTNLEELNGDCMSVPIAVMDMRNGFNLIFLKRIDRGCRRKEPKPTELGGIAKSELRDTLNQLGEAYVVSGPTYKIGEHDASLAYGSVKVPHSNGKNEIFGSASCVISGKNIACFQFLSNDCATLVALAGSKVKFEDAVTNSSVIPSEIAASCKR